MELDKLNNDSNNTTLIGDKNTSLEEEQKLDSTNADEFAAAFPEWDLVPPLQVIKRVKRSL